MESELDGTITLKVSNALRGVNKTMNDKLREASEEAATQAKAAQNEFRNKLQEFDVSLHATNLRSE